MEGCREGFPKGPVGCRGRIGLVTPSSVEVQNSRKGERTEIDRRLRRGEILPRGRDRPECVKEKHIAGYLLRRYCCGLFSVTAPQGAVSLDNSRQELSKLALTILAQRTY